MIQAQYIGLRRIDPDPTGIQPRSTLNQPTLGTYKANYENEDIDMPAIDVWDIVGGNGMLRISDGYHRYTAAKDAGNKQILATIHQGTMLECVHHALVANSIHGLQMSTKDRENGVRNLVESHERAGVPLPSLRAMATLAGVSHETVRRILNKIDPAGQSRSADSFDINAKEETAYTEDRKDNSDWANANENEPEIVQDDQEQEAKADADKKMVIVETNVHDGQQAFKEATRCINDLNSCKKHIATLECGHYLAEHVKDIDRNIEFLRRVFTLSAPARSCDACESAGCSKCNGKGWVCKYQASQLDQDAKHARGTD